MRAASNGRPRAAALVGSFAVPLRPACILPGAIDEREDEEDADAKRERNKLSGTKGKSDDRHGESSSLFGPHAVVTVAGLPADAINVLVAGRYGPLAPEVCREGATRVDGTALRRRANVEGADALCTRRSAREVVEARSPVLAGLERVVPLWLANGSLLLRVASDGPEGKYGGEDRRGSRHDVMHGRPARGAMQRGVS